MKTQTDKKVPLPLKVHESVFNEVDQAAKEKGVTRSDEVEYRLKHYATPLTPQLMVELQNDANKKYEELKADQPEEAIKIQKEVMKLWKCLK